VRKVQVKNGDNWEDAEGLRVIMPGDVFRVFEDDGTPVIGSPGSAVEGDTEFISSSQGMVEGEDSNPFGG